MVLPRTVHRKADNVAGIRKSENVNGRFRVRFEGETKDTWIRFQELVETHTEVPAPSAKAPNYKAVEPKNPFIVNLQKGLQDRQKQAAQTFPRVPRPVVNPSAVDNEDERVVEEGAQQPAENVPNTKVTSSEMALEPLADAERNDEPVALMDNKQELQLPTPPGSPMKSTTISKEEEEMYQRILDESIEAHLTRKMYRALAPLCEIVSGLFQVVMVLVAILNVVWSFVRVYIICVGVSAIVGGHTQNMTSFYRYCNQTLYDTVNQTREIHNHLSFTDQVPNVCMSNHTGIYCERRDLEIVQPQETRIVDVQPMPMPFMRGSYTFTGTHVDEANETTLSYDASSLTTMNMQRVKQSAPYLISLCMNPLTNPAVLYVVLYGQTSN